MALAAVCSVAGIGALQLAHAAMRGASKTNGRFYSACPVDVLIQSGVVYFSAREER